MCRAADPSTLDTENSSENFPTNLLWHFIKHRLRKLSSFDSINSTEETSNIKSIPQQFRFQGSFVNGCANFYSPLFATLNPTSICQMHVTRNICWRLFYKLSTDCSFHGTRQWVKWVFLCLNWNWNVEVSTVLKLWKLVSRHGCGDILRASSYIAKIVSGSNPYDCNHKKFPLFNATVNTKISHLHRCCHL